MRIRWSSGRRFAAALAITVAVVASASCGHSGPVERANLNFTLKDMNGRDVRLSDFAGKPMLINFWATWCGPCQLEAPEYSDLAMKYKDRGLVVLGISVGDSPSEIQQFAKEFKVTYPLLVGADREDVSAAFGLGDGIPMTVFINARGEIHGRLEGLARSTWLDSQIRSLF